MPADLLRRAGIEVRLVGVDGPAVTSAHGVTVTADLTLAELDREAVDMLVLPGGLGGVEVLRGDRHVQALIQHCYDEGRWLAAICAAPTILANLGFLDRRRAVCYPRHGGADGLRRGAEGRSRGGGQPHHHRRGRRLLLPLRPEAGGGAQGAGRPAGLPCRPLPRLRRRAAPPGPPISEELSPQVRRAAVTPCSPVFLALPQVGGGCPLCSTTAWGAGPTPPASSPPSGRGGKAVCLPRCLPGHGTRGPACPDGQRADPPPLRDAGAGEDCPLVGKDAIGLVLVPGLAFDPLRRPSGPGGRLL